MIKNDNYIVILGWMINELKLSGNDLLVYAIIYGFSQSEDQIYSGSAKYLSEFCNVDTKTIYRILKRLTETGLIIKIEKVVNNVTFNDYKVGTKCPGGRDKMSFEVGTKCPTIYNNHNKYMSEVKPSDVKIVFDLTTPEHVLAVDMLKKIVNIGTSMKQPDINKWCKTFDLIHRIDKRDYGWIMGLICLVYDDDFWKNQIRSPEKLRKQINDGKLDRLIVKIGTYETDSSIIEWCKNV